MPPAAMLLSSGALEMFASRYVLSWAKLILDECVVMVVFTETLWQPARRRYSVVLASHLEYCM